MKKLMFLSLILLQAFAFSANATKLGTSISLCSGTERIKLNDNFTCELWMNDMLAFEGTWDFEDEDADAIILTLDIDGTTEKFYMRITEKTRPIRARDGERYVRIFRAEFNDDVYDIC